MALRAETKTTFEAARVIRPFYTGGAVALSEDGKLLASTLGEEALITSLDTGAILSRIEGDGEPITTLALTPDASYLIICSRSLSMRVFALQSLENLELAVTAKLLRTVKPHTTPVVTVAADSTSSLLATGAADGSVKVWDLRGGYTTHTFHGHSGVISALHFFQVDPADAVQSTKSKKRKNKQRGTEAEEVQQDDATAGYRLASGGEDGKVRVWDLHTRESVATLDAHVSVVRGLSYSPEARVLLTASRDKTAILCDARTWQQQSTVAVLQSIESAGFVGNGRFFYTGGETARIRIWSTETGKEVSEEQTQGVETEAIVDVLHHPRLTSLLSVHADQTLVLHSLDPLTSLASNQKIPALPVLRRISGTHDEVIDLAYIGSDRGLLALATNLEDIRLITLQTSGDGSSYFGADVALLKGHTDIVITMSVDWSGHWLATGAKDNTAKLWRLDPASDDYTCYCTFTGHAESIGAVSLPSAAPAVGSKEYDRPLDYPPKFLVTGSQDKTVKRWTVPTETGKAPRATYTRKAHDKDINALATSYSTTSLFASASQDRTVKIWDTETGEAIGVLRGHKRGVWSVAFSPVGTPALTTSESGGASSAKGMVVTGSGDKTVRIWSLSDYSCLRTFEGHANSVLKVVWLPASKAGRGKGATLDNHIDRVWALAVKPPSLLSTEAQTQQGVQDQSMQDADDEEGNVAVEPTLELVSGSADSTLTFWHDTTSATALATTQQATQRVEHDQELQNHVRAANYREAIVLALQLNHPKRLLDLFTTVVNGPREPDSFVGKKDVDAVIGSLSDGQLWSLLRRIRDWNANGRTHNVAQHVLYAILRLIPKARLLGLRDRRRNKAAALNTTDGEEGEDEELAGAMAELSTRDAKSRESVRDVLDGLKAYTQRHYDRLGAVSEERFVLLWALQQMDAVGGGAIDGVVGEGMGDGLSGEDDVVMLNGV
ncbi:U3 small nucleolar RNA-associated protein 13 [Friedmanniomyces endolithicus]|uniref:U3 small nucleolar RNA-associated protein 13 n=1 Tax=Friedmanniomyces endolithicus TaxID=329885 RepID=A0AAN6JWP4_9PEZI|nr:U3 small nucleolar RNA-associated protein 13 [Friedmanniomyces endolithicus]KAK0951988.1 U3 small nucleolar RNA-associated protein 13 [Friedmanniomyces endolithicus]